MEKALAVIHEAQLRQGPLSLVYGGADRGVCLVDPHGDLAESIAGLMPSHRTNDVILFDAASRDCVVGFNPLANRDPSRIDQVTLGVVSAFKRFRDSWGCVQVFSASVWRAVRSPPCGTGALSNEPTIENRK